MVIETQKEYQRLVNNISGKDVIIVVVHEDNRKHPAESNIVSATLQYDNNIVDIVFSHSESLGEDLDVSLLSSAKRFWTNSAKEFYHLTGFTNVYDVSLLCHLNKVKLEDTTRPYVFEHIYELNHNKFSMNKIVPLVKVLEYSRNKLSEVVKHKMPIDRGFVKYNQALITLAKLEKPGLKLQRGKFDAVFKSGYGYSNYNVLTTTGRPSNTFRGINFGALNKNDGTRNQIMTRFDKGMLVEFDYDAFHLRLLAKLLKYNIPTDISLHQYFADNIYNSSYDDAKKISWQILYGGVKVNKNDNPFFYKIEEMASSLYNHFKTHKQFKTHIYKRKFVSSIILEANKNKVLNYFIQSYETEQNIETIKKVQKYLGSRSTNMILYTYDSFLFDLDRTEGLRTVLELKEILQDSFFPVKIKAGLNYGSMQDITERINGYK